MEWNPLFFLNSVLSGVAGVFALFQAKMLTEGIKSKMMKLKRHSPIKRRYLVV